MASSTVSSKTPLIDIVIYDLSKASFGARSVEYIQKLAHKNACSPLELSVAFSLVQPELEQLRQSWGCSPENFSKAMKLAIAIITSYDGKKGSHASTRCQIAAFGKLCEVSNSDQTLKMTLDFFRVVQSGSKTIDQKITALMQSFVSNNPVSIGHRKISQDARPRQREPYVKPPHSLPKEGKEYEEMMREMLQRTHSPEALDRYIDTKSEELNCTKTQMVSRKAWFKIWVASYLKHTHQFSTLQAQKACGPIVEAASLIADQKESGLASERMDSLVAASGLTDFGMFKAAVSHLLTKCSAALPPGWESPPQQAQGETADQASLVGAG